MSEILTRIGRKKSFVGPDYDLRVCSVLLQPFSLVLDRLIILVLLCSDSEAQREHHTAQVHQHGAVSGVHLLNVVRRLEDAVTGMLLSFSLMNRVKTLDFGKAGKYVG